MFKIFDKNVLRTSAFALACLALAGANVKAASMTTTVAPTETYSTQATIGTTGVTNSNGSTGSGPIGFTQITAGSFGLNSNVSLGSFAVSTLADGSTTTYDHTPFTITYNPVTVGSDKFTNSTAVTITGWLQGTVDGSTSSVVAHFDSISNPVFQTVNSNFISTISIANNPLSLVPSTSGNGLTSIQATVATTATTLPPPLGTPEPTAFAILGTAIVGLGIRQRLRKGRQIA